MHEIPLIYARRSTCIILWTSILTPAAAGSSNKPQSYRNPPWITGTKITKYATSIYIRDRQWKTSKVCLHCAAVFQNKRFFWKKTAAAIGQHIETEVVGKTKKNFTPAVKFLWRNWDRERYFCLFFSPLLASAVFQWCHQYSSCPRVYSKERSSRDDKLLARNPEWIQPSRFFFFLFLNFLPKLALQLA